MKKLLPLLLLLTLISGPLLVCAQVVDNQVNGEQELSNKNYKAALDDFTKAIGERNNSDKIKQAYLYYRLAVCQAALNDKGAAYKSYETSLSLNPKLRTAYWDRGVLYESDNNYILALADYHNAILNSKPWDGEMEILYANVAYCQYRLGQYTEAMRADSQAMALNNNYGRAYLIRGNIYLATKKYKLASDDYTTAMFKYGPDMKMITLLYTDRAEAKMRLGKTKDAINDYSLAIKLDTTTTRIAYWNRGAAYHKNGDYQLASNDYTKAIAFYQGDDKNLSKLYNDRAMNELGLNHFSNAIADDSLAITYDATNVYAYLYQAITYTQSAEYQKAIYDYHSVIILKHDDKGFLARIYYQVASDEYFLNEFDKVIGDCTKAITYDPGYSEAYYYRAKVYMKKMKDKGLAAKDFDKVLSLDTTKKSVSYVFSLLYTGKSDEAVSILQNDLLHADENVRVTGDYYNLACLYAILNQPEEANSYLKKAMDNGYSKKYAITDEDLDNIRNTDDYKATIASAAN